MKNIIISIFLFFISEIGHAQDLSFYGVLPAFSLTGRINQKVNYNLFISTTINVFEQEINGVNYPASNLQLYIQPSIIFIYSPKLNLAGSYTYERSNPFNGNYVNEHRLWQQAIFSNALFQGQLTNRFRLEERFIENRLNGEYPLSTRFRYQIGFNTPLQGKKLNEKEFYFHTYNEFYWSLTGIKNSTYSSNWSYAGFGYKIGASDKIELGYLLQISARNKEKDLRYLHLVQISWATNLKKPTTKEGYKHISKSRIN